MDLKKLIDQFVEDNLEEEKKTGTFKCPICGSKVLRNTGYCVKCKKKVSPPSEGEGDAQ
jgi:DNA-directed RNA polymerase subunit RPC12/RpoP